MWFIVYFNIVTDISMSIPVDNHSDCIEIKKELYPMISTTNVVPHCVYNGN